MCSFYLLSMRLRTDAYQLQVGNGLWVQQLISSFTQMTTLQSWTIGPGLFGRSDDIVYYSHSIESDALKLIERLEGLGLGPKAAF